MMYREAVAVYCEGGTGGLRFAFLSVSNSSDPKRDVLTNQATECFT